MRGLLLLVVLSVVFFIFGSCLGQDFETAQLLTEPTKSEWQLFTEGIRGFKGASFFVLALLLVQFLFLLFRTAIGEILGIHRLLVLAILSVGVTIGANLLAGKTVIESIILDSGTLMAYQVLFHQIKRQWEKRDEDLEHLDFVRKCGRVRKPRLKS